MKKTYLLIRFIRTIDISITDPALRKTLSITGEMGGVVTRDGLLDLVRRTADLIGSILTVLLHVTDPGETDTLAIGALVLRLRVTFLSWTISLVAVVSTVIFKVTLPMIRNTFPSVTSNNITICQLYHK